MQVALHNNVKVYNLTAGKSLPEWLAAKKNKRASGGANFTAADERRVELLHDFEFPDFARTVFRTANGSYLFAAGDYPPRLKCYDANDMSVKFSFNADMPIMSGVSLSADFRKFALRGEGRNVTIHNCGNIVERLRVPTTQRCLEFHPFTAELLSAGSGHEIFRFSLDKGCFVESYKTSSDNGVNNVGIFEEHGLTVAACENGTVEAFDHRQADRASVLRVAGEHGVERGSTMTAICTDRNGLTMAVGTNKGQVALYDIRLNRPSMVKDHMTGLPIVKVAMFSARVGQDTHVLSADTQCLRIWTKHDGKNFTTIDAPATIHDFVAIRAQHNLAPPYASADSGVIALCCDTPKIQVHFIPQLNAAPRWAGFLDAITEEMQESDTAVVYDDFKFIAQEEADSLGLSSAEVQDGRVRPAMHGCYVEHRLYRELKAAVDPQGFQRMVDEKRSAKRQEKLDERISKFHRNEPAVATDDGPLGSGLTSASAAAGKRRGGAPSDAMGAMMRGLTPQAIELLSRDPRFAAKMGLDGFGINKGHPEYIKLFQRVQEQQQRATERRNKFEDAQFRVVADTEGAAEDSAPQLMSTSDLDETRRVLRKPARAPRGDDGVTMLETTAAAQGDGAALPVAANDKQQRDARRQQKLKGLTVAERLARQQPTSQRRR